jgi:hypothetical protein
MPGKATSASTRSSGPGGRGRCGRRHQRRRRPGTLITFPTLLAFGCPPILANVSNTIGLVPGVISAAYGYRKELRGQLPRLMKFGGAALAGGLGGAILLLQLPADTFRAIVPILILLACVLVLLQPRLNEWLKQRREGDREDGGVPVGIGVPATGIYGGYFGAAQGVRPGAGPLLSHLGGGSSALPWAPQVPSRCRPSASLAGRSPGQAIRRKRTYGRAVGAEPRCGAPTTVR